MALVYDHLRLMLVCSTGDNNVDLINVLDHHLEQPSFRQSQLKIANMADTGYNAEEAAGTSKHSPRLPRPRTPHHGGATVSRQPVALSAM